MRKLELVSKRVRLCEPQPSNHFIFQLQCHMYCLLSQVKAELHTNSDRGRVQKKAAKKKQQVVSHGEDISDLVEDNAANDNGDDDDFSNLRKLISEGRISGLNERPPSFVPPTPPSAGSSGDRSRGRRAKQPAPKQPQSASRSQSMTPTTSSGGSRVEKQPSRQVTEASYL